MFSVFQNPRGSTRRRLLTGLLVGLLLATGAFFMPTARGRVVGSLETIHDLRASEGSVPNARLIPGRDGCFYGTTWDQLAPSNGSSQTFGSVFRLAPDGALTVLHTFSFQDGAYPRALVQTRDGNFYGTTWKGGTTVFGTVFRLTPAGEFTTLHNFGSDGKYPEAGLVEGSDGNLYGTTEGGGHRELGTVFRVTPDGAFTMLHQFKGRDGGHPSAALIQGKDGALYGTTSFGGEDSDRTGNSGAGTVFRLTPDGQVTTLHRFNTADGELPGELLQGADGNLYGTTAYGGDTPAYPIKYTGWGTIFRLTPGGDFTLLHRFGSAGGRPGGGLVQGANGDLYGASQNGENYDSYDRTGTNGTIFRFSLGSLRRTTLHDFQGDSDGASPTGLLLGDDGSFYGTTRYGGPENRGTAFRLTLRHTPPPPRIALAVSDREAGAVRLTLARPSATDLIVSYAVGGSAVPGVDYVPLRGICRIKAGQTSKVIRVRRLGQAGGTAGKTVLLLFDLSDDYTFSTGSVVTLTIASS